MNEEEKKIEKLFDRAEKYYFQKKYQIAYSVLEKVVSEKPDHKRALPLIADIAFFNGEHEVALSYYRRAIDIVSDPSQEYYRIGQIYLKEQKPDAAIYNFKKALEYNNLLAITYFQLGYVYYSQKQDLQNAYNYWSEFVNKMPNDPQASSIKNILEKIEAGDIRFPGQELTEIRE